MAFQIRYRAFNTETLNMLYDVRENSIYLRSDGILRQIREVEDKLYEFPCDNLKLQAYIGKDDINNTHIYEDDIVKFTQGKNILIGVIVWNKSKYSFEVKVVMGLDSNTKSKTYSLSNKRLQVIGNIHENSNLIK